MVTFYHIIGFTEPTALGDKVTAGHYMGKTSDLVFKTEPDKSIDLDDGCTEVGSEKLSVSFTTLEKLQNSWPLAELWLLPVVDNYYNYNPEIIQIDLRGAEYHLDAKSGDFEKILFSSVLRYPVDSPPYHAITEYFDSYSMVLGRLKDPMNGDTVQLVYDGIIAAEIEPGDMIIERCFAFVGIDYTIDPTDIQYGSDVYDLYGATGLTWWNPDGN